MEFHQKAAPRIDEELDPLKVVPFGENGTGIWSDHRIGLLILVGLFVMVFAGLPETWWFFALAIPAGAVCGLFVFRYRERLAGR